MRYLRKKLKSDGFTIVELALVLIVLGLLIVGIIGGRRVADAAKVQGVAMEARVYRIGIAQFMDVYSQPPGDVSRAKIAGDLGQTSNYNAGDSDLDNCLSDGFIGRCNPAKEVADAWRQLAASGFIAKGILSGSSSDTIIPAASTASGGGIKAIIGKIIPGSKFSKNVGWYLSTSDVSAPFESSYAGDKWSTSSLKLILTGGDDDVKPNTKKALSMPAYLAYMLDRKFDDGLPYSGKIISGKYAMSSIADSTTGYGQALICNDGAGTSASDTNLVNKTINYNGGGQSRSVKNGCVVAFLVDIPSSE